MFGLGIGEILIILVIAFLLFGPKQLPEVARQVGKAVKGFKETADDLRKSVEPEINMIQQEVKMVEQDFQASIKDAEEQINAVTTPAEKQADSKGSANQACRRCGEKDRRTRRVSSACRQSTDRYLQPTRPDGISPSPMRCIRSEASRRAVSTAVIFMIVGLLPLVQFGVDRQSCPRCESPRLVAPRTS